MKIKLFLLSILICGITNAQPGSLDLTFGTGGIITTPIGVYDWGWSVAIQSDGKIVVAGYSSNDSTYEFAIVRYNSDGSLDTTFDSDGKLTVPVGSIYDEAYSVVIQSDGKIVVAGVSWNGADYDIAVIRCNSDGSLDTTFDTDGKLTTPVGGDNDYGYSAAIQSDGKIVVAGWRRDSVASADFAVVRYNSDGSLDTTFDSDGKLTTDVGSYTDFGKSVAIQSDGKIVVAGYSSNGFYYKFAVVRYNSDGSLDNTFSTDGKVITPISSTDDLGSSVAIQSDGKIVVAGYSWISNYDFALIRYNSNGSLDNTFDTDGKVTTPVGIARDYGYSAAIQSDGKIVVAGSSYNGADWDFALIRCNSNGSLDTTFDTDGKVTTPIGSDYEEGWSVAIQSDGKIVVAGVSWNGTDYDFAVARYNGGGGSTAIAEAGSGSALSISPNPTSGEFTVYGLLSPVQIQIYNVFGQVVLQQTVNRKQETVNLSDKSKGIYFIKVTSGESVYTEKVVVQ